jgi:2,4-didehydro-3-deoxy-L-rhamnonate hydrolase
MRLYTFKYKDRICIGAEKKGGLIDLSKDLRVYDMVTFITAFHGNLDNVYKIINDATDIIPFSEVTVCPPVKPRQILCSGLNYKSHIEENPSAKFLNEPRFFAKLPSAVIGPNEPIRHPGESFLVDYEVEFAVVFGKPAYRIAQKNAMDYVFGYTILHDVSSRYIQFKDNNEMLGKNFETFSPIGPCIVTADEIPHPEKCRLSLKLNGKVMQAGSNTDWCFPLSRLIEWLTMAFTMHPGDLMSTGTPAGIGYFRNPQVFLRPDDECELEIEGIGKLVNPVKADPYTFYTQPNS